MTEIATQLSRFNDILDTLPLLLFLGLMFVVPLTALCFWQRDTIIYIIAAVSTILISVTWFTEYPGVAIMLWALAVYEICLMIIGLFSRSTPAAGLSQFKRMFRRD